ncbi:protein arginine N-methyltransferase 5-like [Watersipora subatra]|uniref:protein arginine N-methyltransferase 5-like n=1 Tax=Watersipora subatra TaxID=2589382 RepID=UPI00355AD011
MEDDKISCGLDYSSCVDISSCLSDASSNRYEFLCVPLIHPRYKKDFLHPTISQRPGPYSRSDMTMSCKDWSSVVVGKISPWLQLDSDVPDIRKNSELALKRELDWSSHLSLPAVIIELRSSRCYNLARAILDHSMGLGSLQYWIRVPIVSPKSCVDNHLIEGADEVEPIDSSTEDTWHWWNTFRSLSNRRKTVSICLELTQDLPSNEEMNRWFGEPCRAVSVPTSLFITNKKGFPVLSPSHQAVLYQMFKLGIQVIISGTPLHERGSLVYLQYIEHLYKTREPADIVTQFAKGYEDYLQCPLQPLMDNLESQTYETFEKDPIKYVKYEEAVYQALLDRVPDTEKASTTVIVMVVGAGRGPLVRASLLAAKKADRKIQVYAVEKNPNAVITLENMRLYEWGEQVTVVSCDMRDWKAPALADILVSELLGSFGDNELSPECLDGAQKYLKEDGVSIPCSYSSWLAPIQCPKLHSDVRANRDKDKHPDTCFETPYVVRLHNCQILSEPVEVFTFTHPNRGQLDNERYGCFTFTIRSDTVMHGFAGYFDTVLYKDLFLSIVPKTHSPGMFSWFPIFFPLKEPVHLTAGATVKVHMWRRVSTKNVWYEWTISEPYPVSIHNPKGRSYTIGL